MGENDNMIDSSRIRVLHLVTRMNVGGVATSIDNLINSMDKLQFDSLLVTGKCEPPENEYFELQSPKYEFAIIPTLHKSISIIDEIKSLLEISKLIRKFKPDIVHTHTSKAGALGRVLTKFLFPKVKVVHTFHGHLLIGYFNPFKLKIIIGIEKFLGRLTDQLVAVGTQVRNDLVAVKIAPLQKFNVFLPGLEMPIIKNRDTARTSLDLNSENFYCTFVGRLTQIKRLDRVLDSARIVMTKNKSVKFLIVGDGELMSQLQKTVDLEGLPIQFLGWREDIPAVLNASDMVLLVSDNEGVPLVLIEAAQAGLPIVTTAAGSVGDIAINGKNAIVTSFAPKDLAEAILKLAESATLCESMGNAGKLISAEQFSIKQMVDKHRDLYRKVLSPD
jgi:glycosyltransferase involved in cell wall biosynthesis